MPFMLRDGSRMVRVDMASIINVWQILWKVTQDYKGVIMVASQSFGTDDTLPLRGLLTGQHHPHYHPHPSIY